jgi:hypothetical protein
VPSSPLESTWFVERFWRRLANNVHLARSPPAKGGVSGARRRPGWVADQRLKRKPSGERGWSRGMRAGPRATGRPVCRSRETARERKRKNSCGVS